MNVKKSGVIALALVASWVLLANRGVAADSCLLVTVSEMDRSVNQQVMSAAEFKEFDKAIQLEKRYYPDALRNATKAWREDEFNRGSAFPAGRVVPRAIVGSPERFASKEKAEEQLNKREAMKDARLIKERGIKKPKDEIEREAKKASEASRAAELLKEKLAELIAGKGGAAAADKPAGDKPAGDKADAAKAGLKAL